ncbi:hypothetical protein HY792_03500 [Candidatus Desantisbacteria bacterium]|nr:hypothetical protein [Candidatus Desantisbacteria bacterium]
MDRKEFFGEMRMLKKIGLFLIFIVIIGYFSCKEKMKLLHPILPSTEIIFVRYNPFKPFNGYSLWGMDRDGKNQVKLLSKQKLILTPSWSIDGKKIMFVYAAGIWIIDTTTMKINKIPIKQDIKVSENACWLSNSQQIVFTKTNEREIYMIDISGKSLTKLPIVAKSIHYITCSPIENKIFISSLEENGYKIYITDNKGKKIEQLTGDFSSTSCEGSPCISLDGELIAFNNRIMRKGSKIVLQNLKTKESYEILSFLHPIEQANSICFSSSKKKLVFAFAPIEIYKLTGRFSNDIYSINIDGKNLKNLTNTPDWDESSPSWRPSCKGAESGSDSILSGTILACDFRY